MATMENVVYCISVDILIEFFQKLTALNELIRWGGYTVLFVIVFAETGLMIGFFLPGDSLLVTAGLLASQGLLDIWWLNVLLMTAAIVGDTVGYWIGYHAGPRIFNREESFWFRKSHVERTREFYEKHGGKTIVLARFVPIIRTFAPVVAGVGQMDYKRFLFFNVFGGMGWVGSMTMVGYVLGRTIPDIEKRIHWVILIVIFLSILPIIREIWVARKKNHS